MDNADSPREYLGKFYLDSLVHDADALRGLIRLVGAERVALGTDYPFPLGEAEPGRLIESLTELSPAARRATLLGGHGAWKFLGHASAAERVADEGACRCHLIRPFDSRTRDPSPAAWTPPIPLRAFRDQFHLPRRPDGRPLVYLCGHSLGLQPRRRPRPRRAGTGRLGAARRRGAFPRQNAVVLVPRELRDAGRPLVGALPHEVVFMNSLTVNLHLMMATFYRPTRPRRCILIDEPAFPSDLYAVQSQLRHHGLDPADCLLTVRPRPGEHCVRMEDMEAFSSDAGEEIAAGAAGTASTS